MSGGLDVAALVQAHRILAQAGHGDGTLGHVSARDGAGRGFWLKRAEIGMDEVREAADFLLIGLDGGVLAGEGGLHSEWPLHAEVLRARTDVAAVVHTHARSAALLSASEQALQALTTDGGYFIDHPVPRFRAPRAHIDDIEVGRALASMLGGGCALLIRNHGLVTAGDSVAQATLAALFLERAAATQLATIAAPRAFLPATNVEMAGRQAMLRSERFVSQSFAYYARLAEKST